MLTERQDRHKVAFSLRARARGRRPGQRIRKGLKRDLKRAFLRHFEERLHTCTVKEICEQVGIGRASLYRWLRSDLAFQQRYEGLCNRRFQEHLAALPPITDGEVYWQFVSERTLIRAVNRMYKQREKAGQRYY